MLRSLLARINQSYFEKKVSQSFENFYSQSLNCKAYLEFCREIQGQNYPVQNNLSKKEYLDMINFLSEKSHRDILDLGCGTGMLLKELHLRHNVSGADIAFSLPELNITRTSYQNMTLADNSLDIILAIDSLYMVRNKKKLFQKLKKALRSDGSLEIHLTTLSKLESNDIYQVAKDTFSSLEITDYTEQDLELWENAHNYLIQNEDRFQCKNCKSVYRTKLQETQKNLNLKDQIKRFHIMAIN